MDIHESPATRVNARFAAGDYQISRTLLWFYLLWTRHHLNHFRQIAASKATTMGHIQRVHLTEAKVLVPPASMLEAVDACFASLLDQRIENELQAQTLATLRDTLLPRLISGRLRLPEAEHEVMA